MELGFKCKDQGERRLTIVIDQIHHNFYIASCRSSLLRNNRRNNASQRHEAIRLKMMRERHDQFEPHT
jgi:hypothetical protein